MKDKVRVDCHFTEEEVKAIDKKAKEEGRSRKNYCEQAIKNSSKKDSK